MANSNFAFVNKTYKQILMVLLLDSDRLTDYVNEEVKLTINIGNKDTNLSFFLQMPSQLEQTEADNNFFAMKSTSISESEAHFFWHTENELRVKILFPQNAQSIYIDDFIKNDIAKLGTIRLETTDDYELIYLQSQLFVTTSLATNSIANMYNYDDFSHDANEDVYIVNRENFYVGGLQPNFQTWNPLIYDTYTYNKYIYTNGLYYRIKTDGYLQWSQWGNETNPGEKLPDLNTIDFQGVAILHALSPFYYSKLTHNYYIAKLYLKETGINSVPQIILNNDINYSISDPFDQILDRYVFYNDYQDNVDITKTLFYPKNFLNIFDNSIFSLQYDLYYYPSNSQTKIYVASIPYDDDGMNLIDLKEQIDDYYQQNINFLELQIVVNGGGRHINNQEKFYYTSYNFRIYKDKLIPNYDISPLTNVFTIAQQVNNDGTFSFDCDTNEFFNYSSNILIDGEYYGILIKDNNKVDPYSLYDQSKKIIFDTDAENFNNENQNHIIFYIPFLRRGLDNTVINHLLDWDSTSPYIYEKILYPPFIISSPKVIYKGIEAHLFSKYSKIWKPNAFSDLSFTCSRKGIMPDYFLIIPETYTGNQNSGNLRARFIPDDSKYRSIQFNLYIYNKEDFTLSLKSPTSMSYYLSDKDSNNKYAYSLRYAFISNIDNNDKNIFNICDQLVIKCYNVNYEFGKESMQFQNYKLLNTNLKFEFDDIQNYKMVWQVYDKYSTNMTIDDGIAVFFENDKLYPPILEEKIPTIFLPSPKEDELIKFSFTHNNNSNVFTKCKYNIFNFSNNLIYSGEEEIQDEDGEYYIKCRGLGVEINYNTFYKIIIQLSDDNEIVMTPWSNVSLFKISSIPTITMNYQEEIETPDLIVFPGLFDIKWDKNTIEPIEKIECQYRLIEESDDGIVKVVTLPKENLSSFIINNSTTIKNIKTKSFFDFLEFREFLNTDFADGETTKEFNLHLLITCTTENGSFNIEKDTGNYIFVQHAVSDYFIGNNCFKVNKSNINININTNDDKQQYWHTIYNNDIKILEEILPNKGNTNIIDYSSTFNNKYYYYTYRPIRWREEGLGFYIIRKDRGHEIINNNFIESSLINLKTDQWLNITPNNKVSSFKNTRLETKTDTLGGIYPKFYRNPNTKYKEFQLSGTITYQDFLSHQGFDSQQNNYSLRAQTPGPNIENLSPQQEIYNEYKFREEVIDFLQNSETLLYKSPTEGCIPVKIMNLSLTPKEQLGRMIYDFSCTCYEISDLQSYLNSFKKGE